MIVGSAFVRVLLDQPGTSGLRALAALTEDLARGVRDGAREPST